ncbi:MAG: Phosphoenolpyruvate-protein phosphotransferase of system [Phycisphaerales bacterium]|nr:Phosphoenolpyruvate-protein phosphotransferase of system [Phycisphaerales bacterium]
MKGIGVSPGVVICPAVVLDAEDLVIPRRLVDVNSVDKEVARLREAFTKATDDLNVFRAELKAEHGNDIASIFDFHAGLLKDKTLLNSVLKEIQTSHTNAEYAVSVAMKKLAGTFLAMKDSYLADRVKDVYDIEKRVLRTLIGNAHEGLLNLQQNVCVIAHDLLPSQTAALDKNRVKGFACDVGGRTSHTAIVARAMGIPAVVGLGNVSSAISGGDLVIIDGTRGVVIVDPDADQLTEHEEYVRQYIEFEKELATLKDLPAVTTDGHAVTLMANIEFPAEINDALDRGAKGIGLYRTEFLYMASVIEPTEEDHYLAYADAVRRLDGRPLVIRTLDLGADKYIFGKGPSKEANPFLGDRSIRMCLHNLPMFKAQLRAILRAAVHGDVRIMFPMISTIMELRQARMVLNDVIEELEDEGASFKGDVPVGMMVEVPSAALLASNFAREVAFFSIGTNDLIQYTLAVDRTNERVAGLFTPAHPAVLSLIRDVIRAANRQGIGVSVCGEMAGEPLYTLLLLGLGLNTFSMNGPDVPEVKKIIRSTTTEHARQVARKVMSFDSERQVVHYLREETRKIIPEAF